MAERNFLWVAQWGVRNGLSANQILATAKEMEVGVRRATGLQIIAQVRNNAAIRQASFEALFIGLPQRHEIGDLPSAVSTKFVQYVDLYVVDKRTGLVHVKERALITDTLLSRDAAIEFIVNRERSAIASAGFRGPTWDTLPDSTVVSGIYTATNRFVPDLGQ